MYLSTTFLSLIINVTLVCSTTIIPRYDGTYAVNGVVRELVDDTRMINITDGNTTTTRLGSRRLVTSVFYPVANRDRTSDNDYEVYLTPYMTRGTALYEESSLQSAGIPLANGSFVDLRLELCRLSRQQKQRTKSFRRKRWPVVLFSTGLGVTRFEYGAIASAIASYGYIVVTVDHPGQTTFVEFSDGSYTVAGPLDPPTTGNDADVDKFIAPLLADRVLDLEVVLRTLRAGQLLPRPLKHDKHAVYAMGHSFGGAAAAQIMAQHPAIKSGINLDGALFGTVVTSGFSNSSSATTHPQSFLIFGNPINNSTTDPSWSSFQATLSPRQKLELSLDRAQHLSFTDLPLLADSLGLTALFPAITQYIGEIRGERVRTILARYVDAWFRYGHDLAYSHTGSTDPLLKGPSAEFPEVRFLSSPLS